MNNRLSEMQLSEINQLINDLRQEVVRLQQEVVVLKSIVAEETKVRYDLYKKISSRDTVQIRNPS